MDAGGAIVAGADAERDLAELEVAEEIGPFFGGEVAVLLAGTFRPATGDEGPMMGDDVISVDRYWWSRVSQLSECLSARGCRDSF